MTPADYAFAALCLWREARGEDVLGMTAVACVIRNRVTKHGSTYFAEVTKPKQFSSMTYHGDPQLVYFPKDSDTSWQIAQQIAQMVIDGKAVDTTHGSTLYFDDSISFPKTWDKTKVEFEMKLGRLNFYREIA